MDKRHLKRNFQLSENVVDLVMIDKRHLKRSFEELRSIRKTVRTSTWRAGRRKDRPLHPDPVSVPELIRRPRPEQRGEELSQTRWRTSFESFCLCLQIKNQNNKISILFSSQKVRVPNLSTSFSILKKGLLRQFS